MSVREYSGNAKATKLNGSISNTDTALALVDGTGYPTGAAGPFVITVDVGLAAEEKILCTARSGNNVTAGTRGYDGTTAAAHDNQANVTHTISAVDLREANAHGNAAGAADPHPGYVQDAEITSMVTLNGAQTLTNKTLTTPTIGSFTNAQHSHSNAAGGGLVTTGVSLAGGSTITTSAAGVKGLVIKGSASQTANLIEYQDDTGTLMFGIGNTGGLVTRAAANDGSSQVRTDAHGALFGRLLCIVGGASKWIELYE